VHVDPDLHLDGLLGDLVAIRDDEGDDLPAAALLRRDAHARPGDERADIAEEQPDPGEPGIEGVEHRRGMDQRMPEAEQVEDDRLVLPLGEAQPAPDDLNPQRLRADWSSEGDDLGPREVRPLGQDATVDDHVQLSALVGGLVRAAVGGSGLVGDTDGPPPVRGEGLDELGDVDLRDGEDERGAPVVAREDLDGVSGDRVSDQVVRDAGGLGVGPGVLDRGGGRRVEHEGLGLHRRAHEIARLDQVVNPSHVGGRAPERPEGPPVGPLGRRRQPEEVGVAPGAEGGDQSPELSAPVVGVVVRFVDDDEGDRPVREDAIKATPPVEGRAPDGLRRREDEGGGGVVSGALDNPRPPRGGELR
jgi:hypothetical protein